MINKFALSITFLLTMPLLGQIPVNPGGGGGTSITLTTTGSSGASTLTGSVLNIPIYSVSSGIPYPSGNGFPIVSGGSAWGTTVAAPTGTVVGTTDTQTLTNKTLDGVSPTTMGFVDPTSSIQTQFGAKAPLASPTLTGTPLAPTATAGTNTTQIATTAFVLANRTAVANIQITLPTSSIAANTCTSAATATMTGVVTTSVFEPTFATDPASVTGWGTTGGLNFKSWPTANTLNWRVCNETAASITPGAMTMNVGAK